MAANQNAANDEPLQFFIEDAKTPFSGWDFSYIEGTGRMDTEPLPWSYTSNILMHLRNADTMLDMGTGGGEFLSKLKPLPPYTCATEGYEPNVPEAINQLEPLGVQVFKIDDDRSLPFKDEEFELIINKHESYSPHELRRILKPGGCFITQQVGGQNETDLNEFLDVNQNYEFKHWNLSYAIKELEGAGSEVTVQKEAYPVSRFFDIGALVYYLKAVPWQVPDFSVEKYHNRLTDIHSKICRQGYIDFRAHRFFIIAKK